jgi:hypothetical protein
MNTEDSNDDVIRVPDCKSLIGKTLDFNVRHEPNGYHIECKNTISVEDCYPSRPSVWAGKTAFNNKENLVIINDRKFTFTGTVTQCFLMERGNGGRSNSKRYESVAQYFKDPLVKQRVMNITYGGTLARLADRGGDPDQADLIIKVMVNEDTVIDVECDMWDAKPPVSWYTEKFGGLPQFEFKKGFFETSVDAVEFYTILGQTDDLFGQRYFPVLVFPKSVEDEKIEDIIYYAKGCSNRLDIDDNWVIGLRCKTDEYRQCIERCYEVGGKVPIDCQYDWI